MDISTYEAWKEEERRDIQQSAAYYPDNSEYVQRDIDWLHSLDEMLSVLLACFPYAVIAEGEYSEFSYACRWCWHNFGPQDGPCIFHWQVDYPGCSLILETEFVTRGTWTDRNGKVYPFVWKNYTAPADHEHEGEWCFLWLKKTSQDFGFGEFYFGNESDHVKFLSAFPTFNWSEDWKKEGL